VTVSGCDALELTVSRIVVAAGAAMSGGLSEPSALATKLAGRIAVAAPFVDGIELVVACGAVAGGFVTGVVAVELAAVELPAVERPLEELPDPPPHALSGRTAATAPRSRRPLNYTRSAADDYREV
jgi:hypothetical protein